MRRKRGTRGGREGEDTARAAALAGPAPLGRKNGTRRRGCYEYGALKTWEGTERWAGRRWW